MVIRPQPCDSPGMTTWLLSRERSLHGVTVAKLRILSIFDHDGERTHLP